MMTPPEVFQDDGFLPDLELDITTSRPEYAEGWREKLLGLRSKCDLWRIIPTTMVSSAFSFSITALTSCSLATLTIIDEKDPISFGLWSYTDPDRLNNGTMFIPKELTSECRAYDVSTSSGTGLPGSGLILDDNFRTAKAFGVLAVCIGFLTMASLWMGVLRDYESTTNWRRWVGGSLLMCCFFEGMTLFVLESGVCDADPQKLQRNCRVSSGANWVIASCVLWFASGVVLLKWPRAKEYAHSSLAADESDEHNHEYPAEFAGDYDGMWGGLMKSLGSEEVEMKPYRDNPEEDQNGDRRPSLPQQSSSLRDLILGFDDELQVSFEPASGMTPNKSDETSSSSGASESITVTPLPVPFTPRSAMERLRNQSTIHPSEPPPPRPATPPPPPIPPQPEDNLRDLLDGAFGDDDEHDLENPLPTGREKPPPPMRNPPAATSNLAKQTLHIAPPAAASDSAKKMVDIATRSSLKGILEPAGNAGNSKQLQRPQYGENVPTRSQASSLGGLLDAFDDDSL